MASISSLGVGSGLDLESIVTQLTDLQRTQKKKPVENKKTLKEAEVSGLSSLKSTLTSFQDVLKGIKDGSSTNKRSVITNLPSENPAFSYETTSSITNCTHDIAVEQLAQGSKLKGVASGFFSETIEGKTTYRSSSAGTVSFSLGSGDDAKTFSVDIGKNDSLETICKKVNEADGNPGVTLNYIVDSSGNVNFFAESSETGDGKDLRLSGDTEILGFTGDGASNEVQKAQNAIMVIDGVSVTSATNEFNDQVSGLKLTAKEVSAKNEDGTYATNNIKVSEDKSGLKSTLNSLVSAFNNVLSECTKLGKRDTYTDGANNYDGGNLAGDALTKNVQSSLKSVIQSFSPETGETLYKYGISLDKKGELTLDSTKFDAAADGNYESLISVFKDLATKLDDAAATYTKDKTGIIAQRSELAQSQIDTYNDKITQINEYLENYENRLRKKYTNLDTLLANMSSNLDYVSAIMSSSE